ncbi:MAG: UTP--glucose-1-phosphate uridylyltransferase GalU [Clostridia bacterium]|nr:UTP--glucose-1-phosphate uridylyltransferase GalU [Clostridia bacterium]
MKVRKAVIPAAGLGTRFLPATKAQPKEMLPIVDKPAIQYIVEEILQSGITDILIITGRNKRALEDHFDKSVELEYELEQKEKHEMLKIVQNISEMINIHYVRQKQANGLGHAINCAKTFIGDEPFAVLLADDIIDAPKPCLKQLIEMYDQHQCSVLGVQQVPKEDVNKYGIVDGKAMDSSCYTVNTLVEKPPIDQAPSDIAIIGRYIITPEIFDILDHTQPGAGGEIQLTDALKELVTTQKMIACKFDGKRYDIGDKQGFLQATVEFALKRDDIKGEFKQYLRGLKY